MSHITVRGGTFALLGAALFGLSGCSRNPATTQAAPGTAGMAQAGSRKARPAAAKTRFRVQEVADSGQGMIFLRMTVPEDWKADGRVEWNYQDLYRPSSTYARAEAPDGSAWFEAFPAEQFYWIDDPRWDNFKAGGSVGGIHHRNITIQGAMQRYVISRYRGKAANLRILGYRPVTNLPQALGGPSAPGEGICFRLRYEVGNQPVDEEFYAQMSPILPIPYRGPLASGNELHRTLWLVHSLGAKGGRLESMRPLIGSIAGSAKFDNTWWKRQEEVRQKMNDEFARNLQRGYDNIRAAGEMSRAISANNDALLRNMDAKRAASAAASRAAAGANSNDASYRHTDDFDQYIRDTEHVMDSWGQVSDQSNQYNYHWTDGFGNFVHANDPNYDPNAHSNQRYEKTTPVH